MSLIKCPECGKEISDKAASCPTCGYPMKEVPNKLSLLSPSSTGMNICPKCGKLIIAKEKCPDCGTSMIDCNCTEEEWTDMLLNGTVDKWEKQMRNKYVLSSNQFDANLYSSRIKDEEKEELYYNELINNASDSLKNKNVPTCPTCRSTNVEKISLTKKAIGGAMFGLLSSDVRKTMHCKSCGYKW